MGKKSRRGQWRSGSGRKKSEPEDDKRALRPVLKFVLSFLASLGVLGFAYSLLTARFEGIMIALERATAILTGAVVSLLSDDVLQTGESVVFRGFPVEIISECTGLLEMVIYCAAVVAYPAGIRKKLLGIGAGVLAIYLLNVVRIIVLLLVGAYSRRVFDFLHLYFWQATLIIMIAAVWLGWLYLVVYREKEETAVVPG